jgi:hypothetical protein
MNDIDESRTNSPGHEGLRDQMQGGNTPYSPITAGTVIQAMVKKDLKFQDGSPYMFTTAQAFVEMTAKAVQGNFDILKRYLNNPDNRDKIEVDTIFPADVRSFFAVENKHIKGKRDEIWSTEHSWDAIFARIGAIHHKLHEKGAKITSEDQKFANLANEMNRFLRSEGAYMPNTTDRLDPLGDYMRDQIEKIYEKCGYTKENFGRLNMSVKLIKDSAAVEAITYRMQQPRTDSVGYWQDLAAHMERKIMEEAEDFTIYDIQSVYMKHAETVFAISQQQSRVPEKKGTDPQGANLHSIDATGENKSTEQKPNLFGNAKARNIPKRDANNTEEVNAIQAQGGYSYDRDRRDRSRSQDRRYQSQR